MSKSTKQVKTPAPVQTQAPEVTQAPAVSEEQQAEQLQKAEDKALEQASESVKEQADPNAAQDPVAMPVATEAAASVLTAAPKPQSLSDFADKLPELTAFEKAVAEGSLSKLVEIRTLTQVFQEYAVEMDPTKSISAANIAKNQTAAWRAIRGVLTSDEGFNQGIRLIMAFFREYSKGAFASPYVMRGLEDVIHNRMTNVNRKAFAYLMRLFTAAAELESVKQVSKFVELKSCVESVTLTPNQGARLIAFFSA